jgi:hypothetical protein
MAAEASLQVQTHLQEGRPVRKSTCLASIQGGHGRKAGVKAHRGLEMSSVYKATISSVVRSCWCNTWPNLYAYHTVLVHATM